MESNGKKWGRYASPSVPKRPQVSYPVDFIEEYTGPPQDHGGSGPYAFDLRVVILGKPIPQPRPDTPVKGKGGKIKAWVVGKGHKVHAYRRAVRDASALALSDLGAGGLRLDQAVRVDLLFLFPRVQRLDGKAYTDGQVWKATTPDEDNCRKAANDGLDESALVNDSRIVAGLTVKAYVEQGGRARTEIRLRSINQTPEALWASI